jgi:hypothetical protein
VIYIQNGRGTLQELRDAAVARRFVSPPPPSPQPQPHSNQQQPQATPPTPQPTRAPSQSTPQPLSPSTQLPTARASSACKKPATSTAGSATRPSACWSSAWPRSLAHAGDNIVATSNLYGGTYNQLKVFMPRFGIQTRFVEGDDAEEFRGLIDEKTKAVYVGYSLVSYFFF